MLFITSLVIYATIEAPRIAKRKQWKELAVFLALTIAGVILNALLAAGVKLPYIADVISRLFGAD